MMTLVYNHNFTNFLNRMLRAVNFTPSSFLVYVFIYKHMSKASAISFTAADIVRNTSIGGLPTVYRALHQLMKNHLIYKVSIRGTIIYLLSKKMAKRIHSNKQLTFPVTFYLRNNKGKYLSGNKLATANISIKK